MKRVAFYATIKPPDHPIASGDRLIAQNLMAAFEVAGFDVALASRFIAYSKKEAGEILAKRKTGALQEAEALIQKFKTNPPDIWVTYHPYCKAPDWIGPVVTQTLGIPYVTIEAAKTGQGFENGGDRWAAWRKEAQNGIRKANLHLAFKPADRDYLTALLGNDQTIKMMPPFFDARIPERLPAVPFPGHWRPSAPVLLSVGMMRPGKKVKNYQLIAEALRPLQSLHWNLLVLGDGPELGAVEQLFCDFDDSRICFAGAVSHHDVLAFMEKSSIFVWPGWKEPIGMVYLEAQMMGLPVAALDSMGVSLTVRHGSTGLLTPEADIAGFSENLSTLISHPTLRKDFGENGRRNVTDNHSMQAGAEALKRHLSPLLM